MLNTQFYEISRVVPFLRAGHNNIMAMQLHEWPYALQPGGGGGGGGGGGIKSRGVPVFHALY